MVGFETLFLGLVMGSQSVELAVSTDVVAVEVFLDGGQVAALKAPPWRFECDFGRQLRPHELVAIALDVDGNEIGSARRWINMPHPQVEAQIFLEPGARQDAPLATIAWASVRGQRPNAVALRLDGRELPVEQPMGIELPGCDPEQVHVVTAEVEFPDGRVAHADAAFGGDLGESVRTELTAIPIEIEPGAETPSAASLAGWFSRDGAPLRVVAVERAPVDLVLVLDPKVGRELETRRNRSVARVFGQTERQSLLPLARYRLPPSGRQSVRDLAAAEGEDALFVVHAVPNETRGAENEIRRLFPILPAAILEPRRLVDYLNALDTWPSGVRRPWIAGAVAVAGTKAAARNRARAVAVLVEEPAPGRDDLAPAHARSFLADLNVPLAVWSIQARKAYEDDRWGAVEAAATETRLIDAFERLLERVRRQRIVWLDGAHLPQQVALTDRARGVTLAR